MSDIATIASVIDQARRRMRLQSACNALALASVLAAVTAMVVILLWRHEVFSDGVGFGLIGLCAAAVIGTTATAYMRKISDHVIAQRIDRASDLADRLGTAWAFDNDGIHNDDETEAFRQAAIRDGIEAAADAKVAAATPFKRPRDLYPALGFTAAAVLVAGLYFPSTAPVGVAVSVTLNGSTMPDTPIERGTLVIHRNTASGNTSALTNALGKAGNVSIAFDNLPSGSFDIEYQHNPESCRQPKLRLPCQTMFFKDIKLAWDTELQELATEDKFGSVSASCTDGACELVVNLRSISELDVATMDKDDLDYTRALNEDLKKQAQDTKDTELLDYTKRVEDILRRLEKGELTKEQMHDELAKAKKEFEQGTDKTAKELNKEATEDLKAMGKALKKQKETKKLGEALSKQDFDKARQEMEKLAKALENDKLDKDKRDKIAKALDNAAKKLDQRDNKRDQKHQQSVAKVNKSIKKLQRQLRNEQNPAKRQKLEERLSLEKQALKKLQRNKDRRQQSSSKRSLKQLSRNMKQAAQQMRKQQQNQQQRQQTAQKWRDMQRNVGKVSQDRKRIRRAQDRKVATQLDNLREALRRAKKRGGSKGAKNRFGKRRKRNQNFARRAAGKRPGKGSSPWKPGSTGQGKGKNGKNGKNGGQGKGQKPGNNYGDGHDPDYLGDATKKGGHTKEMDAAAAKHGRGPSMRETILSAAEKGFATTSYKKVFTNYKRKMEEVIENEKVPAGYRFYINKYFQKIKPHTMDSSSPEKPAP